VLMPTVNNDIENNENEDVNDDKDVQDETRRFNNRLVKVLKAIRRNINGTTLINQ
jgi:hypothetical protein